MIKKILYFYEYYYKTVIFYNDGNEVINKNYKEIFNEFCLKEYTTLSGRVNAIRTIYKYMYNTPLYINDKNIFIKINMKDYNIWLNVYTITRVKKENENNVIIIFDNGVELLVNKNLKMINKVIAKGKNIQNKSGFIL